MTESTNKRRFWHRKSNQHIHTLSPITQSSIVSDGYTIFPYAQYLKDLPPSQSMKLYAGTPPLMFTDTLPVLVIYQQESVVSTVYSKTDIWTHSTLKEAAVLSIHYCQNPERHKSPSNRLSIRLLFSLNPLSPDQL